MPSVSFFIGDSNPENILVTVQQGKGWAQLEANFFLTPKELQALLAAGQRALEEWQEQDMRAAEAQRARQEVGA